MSIEEKIWNYFKSKGLNDYGVAGLMGNLRAESSLNPHNLQSIGNKKLNMTDDEYVIAIDNGTYTKEQFINDRFGFGLAQWTYNTRKKALYEFVKSQNKSIGNLETQLDFLYKELSEDYKSLLNTLKTATSVLQASNAVLFQYEKPANQGESAQNKRADYGQIYYDKYATLSSNNIENVEAIIGGNKSMKYNENNKPLVCMQTTSKCYKGTTTGTPVGILWHSTGCNNPTLKRYVQPSDDAPDREYWLKLLGKNKYGNDWNHIDRSAGMNCWIGQLADGTVTTVQTMPWNYRPWGCGKGKNGSCNGTSSGEFFIQFEIAEDDMYGEEHFKKSYQEAIEITAYLCKMFNLDPLGEVKYRGIKVPVILCHYDSYHLGLGNNHGDVYTWFKKHGKDMNDVRNDVAVLMKSDIAAPTSPVQPEKVDTIKKNDIVKIASNATYYSGKSIPDWVKKKNWVVNSVNGNRIVINKSEDGKHTINSPINIKYLTVVKSVTTDSPFAPYEVKITVDALNVRDGAGLNSNINGVLKGESIYTIVEEANGEGATKWLRLKPISGWIASDHVKKI